MVTLLNMRIWMIRKVEKIEIATCLLPRMIVKMYFTSTLPSPPILSKNTGLINKKAIETEMEETTTKDKTDKTMKEITTKMIIKVINTIPRNSNNSLKNLPIA